MEGRSNLFMFMLLLAGVMFHGTSAQTRHVVGDALGWTVPPGGEVAYSTWAATQTFAVGDTLEFNFTNGAHDVVEVTESEYNSCSTNSPVITTSPARITLNSTGSHYFICTFTRHCSLGQRLAINVSAGSTAPAPQPATPPPSGTPRTAPSRPPSSAFTPPPAAAPAPSPSRAVQTYTVGDSLGWTVPNGQNVYQTWASGRNFMVGDILEFNFANGAHDVVEVTESEYNSCSTNSPVIATSPARITLNSAGSHYFICTFTRHCSLGQRLMVNVTGGSTTGGPTGQPTTPSTRDGTNPPRPENSAASFAAGALPFTFLAIIWAFLYN